MVNVSFDINNLNPSKMGIGRYGFQLVFHLLKRNLYNYYALTSPNINHKEIGFSENNIILKSSINSVFLRSRILPIFSSLKKIDLHHSLENNCFYKYNFKYKTITTIHDAIVFINPEYFTRKHQYFIKLQIKESIKFSDIIICPSSFTKETLLKLFKIRPERIFVIPLGSIFNLKKSNKPQLPLKLKFLKNQKYLLSVCSFEPRKNIGRLIKAYRDLKSRKKIDNIILVLVGGKGWLESGIDKSKEELKKEGIIVLGFVEDQWLPAIYANAMAFIYPSLHEGFGLPPLEAMSCGTPVLLSNASSLPEVGGDVALYFDPLSVEAIEEAIEKIIFNVDLQKTMSEKSLIQSKQFSWDKTAQQTEEVYAKVLGL